MFGLAGRLRQAWKASKEEDKDRPRFDLNRDELAFLPAALEVTETPVRPMGRIIVYVIILLFILALIWGYFGRIDTVAVASGRIVPGDRVKVIQPLESGSVTGIYVRNGQEVKEGELVLELDATDATADVARLRGELLNAQLDFARTHAHLHEDAKDLPEELVPDRAPPGLLSAARARLRQEKAQIQAQLAVLDRQFTETQAERAMVQADIARLGTTLPLIEQRVEAWDTLAKQGHGSRLTYLENEQLLRDQRGELLVLRRRLDQVAAQLATLEERKIELKSNAMAEQQEAYEESQRRLYSVRQELAKAEKRLETRRLLSPVDGEVQQLAVHTLGGVVQPGDPLMIVVPEDASLAIEAKVLNKDIGFVKEGQEVEIKIESFPFTRYGLIPGEVLELSRDAAEDEQEGLIYLAEVEMKERRILVGDRWVQLAPGMNATVEIKTGSRRLIHFFLSPFMEYQNEALRER
ncbi:MAG: HlyD family type I secretion periplasmic adaptor subunit [Rhodospirillales bacterium]